MLRGVQDDVAKSVGKLGIDVAAHGRIVPRRHRLVQVRNAGELQAPFVLTEMCV